MLIDTHTHLYAPQFDEDREEAVERALQAGVGKLFLPAIDEQMNEALFELTRKHPDMCYPMMGLHPTSVNDNLGFREDLKQVERWLSAPPEGITFVGVGEVGMDLYWSRDFQQEQEEAFRFQVELALRHDLPLVIHTREAWEEMCAVLEEYRGRGLRAVMHSFSGTLGHYKRLKSMGDFLFGIGGPLTYKRSEIAEILPNMELDDLVLETDAPYLPPVPYRGKRNESAYLPLVAYKVAELRGISFDEVVRRTTANVARTFRKIHFS